jgi:RNA polymerase sigma factor (sigma-70 family)
MNDAELLLRYTTEESETTFHALVERHLPLVYSTALRQVGEPGLAESLSHVVFILLARRSAQMSSRTILPDWLFRTTRDVIAKSLPRDGRGRSFLYASDYQPAERWLRFLDGALAKLGEVERGALLLHYFQFRRSGQVGLALGVSEDTAQKIIQRAIRQLLKLLLRNGANVNAEVLPGLLMTRGTQSPPPYLPDSITAAALNRVTLSTPVYALLQGAGRESVWPRVRTVLGKAAAIVVIAGLVVFLWPQRASRDSSAFSFETKIVVRPPYVAPPPLPPELAPAKPLVVLSNGKTINTSRPWPLAQQVAVAPSRPVPTNATWVPAPAVVQLVGPAQTLIESNAPLSEMPPPDPGFSVLPAVWSSVARISPAQNLVQFPAGFGTVFNTNLTPWSSAQRSVVVMPTGGRTSIPPKRR